MAHGFLDTNGIFTSITYPGATFTAAYGINDSGQIVGIYQSGATARRGFLYDGGTFNTINYPGAESTVVNGINAKGQLVGSYVGLQSGLHGFLYNGQTYISIDCPGLNTIYGINDDGQMVGILTGLSPQGYPNGFLFSGGGCAPLNYPHAQGTRTYCINDEDQIAGSYIGTPESSSIFLFGTGILGAFAFARRELHS